MLNHQEETIPTLEIVDMEKCKKFFLNRLNREWLDIVSNDKGISSGLLKYVNDNKEILFELNKKIEETQETQETEEPKKKITKYTFILPITYPFSPPKILINKRPYISSISMPSTRFIEMLKKLEGKDCLCCDSKVCYVNWGPAFTIRHLMTEIEYNKNIIKRIVKYILLNNIKKKYLIEDIQIEEWI